jgi:hypothetical protein
MAAESSCYLWLLSTMRSFVCIRKLMLSVCICMSLSISLSNAEAQRDLPISIGESRSDVAKRLQDHETIVLDAAQRLEDSVGGWLIDSVYDRVRYRGVWGTLSVTFASDDQAKVIGLHWEGNVRYAKACKVLRSLRHRFGGTLDMKYSTWSAQVPGILREAIYYQRDLIYREHFDK